MDLVSRRIAVHGFETAHAEDSCDGVVFGPKEGVGERFIDGGYGVLAEGEEGGVVSVFFAAEVVDCT